MMRNRWIGRLAAVVAVLGVCVAFAAAQERERPSRERPEGEVRRDRPAPEAEARRERPAPEARPAPARVPGRVEAERERRAPGEAPRPVVIQFNHIPVESFMHTLKQLARHPRLEEALKELPHAVNEEANAFVLIAPPELAHMLAAMARELDKPSEFHERNRDREAREREALMKMRMMQPGAARQPGEPGARQPGQLGPCPHCGRGPHAEKAPAMPPGRPPVAPNRAPEGPPMGEGLGGLLGGRISTELGLSEEQIDKIRSMFEETREQHEQLMRRLAEMREKRARELREEVLGVLRPEQRERARRLLEEVAPKPEAKGRHAPERPGRPEHDD